MQNVPITAYIAVGSNLGDRQKNIEAAIRGLNDTAGTRVARRSSLIENPAVGGPAGSPDFLNGVVEIETAIEPHALLTRLLEIERSLGRQRRDKWEPRVIDLDLILYGSQCISSGDLVVPHPLMQTRQFVLQPLAELSPDLVHPALGVTVATLLQNLPRGRRD